VDRDTPVSRTPTVHAGVSPRSELVGELKWADRELTVRSTRVEGDDVGRLRSSRGITQAPRMCGQSSRTWAWVSAEEIAALAQTDLVGDRTR
jgi:hypothetical protein